MGIDRFQRKPRGGANFLNCPFFHEKISQIKGISGTRIEPGGSPETNGSPVFSKTGRFVRFSPVR
jgi:hypothetical protein